ncbi:hypothetical protein KSP40_PGU011743 [Platanthera guangdongensis]|uniref:Uncharacterized protein n=1 Tax=Platanthera guangdongensis TaxID=2320717 RepID=A0ABR2MDI0_9ASPA
MNSSIKTKSETDHLYVKLLGSAIIKVWRDNTYLNRCIFSPWSNLRCYLESTLQVCYFLYIYDVFQNLFNCFMSLFRLRFSMKQQEMRFIQKGFSLKGKVVPI